MDAARSDLLIVGAGSAGCVLAERLSRDPRRTVTVLEGGGSAPATAGLSCLPIGPASTRVRHFDTLVPELTVVRGRGLGGSSAVNGGYFMRWHDGDLLGLAAAGDWSMGQIENAYAELDGPRGTMRAAEWRTDELTDAGRAFEDYWSARVGVRTAGDRRPIVGLNRVVSNHIGRQRFTAFDGYLRDALSRPNLRVRTDVQVTRIRTDDAGVTGVTVLVGETESDLDADEVIVCAGTLGTAELLFRSEILTAPLPLVEHREVLVRYRRRRPQPVPPTVLQTVVHVADGCEIRCYTDDFARFVEGTAAVGPVVGVAAMYPGVAGGLTWTGATMTIDLGPPDPASWTESTAVARCVDDVVAMLSAPEFAGVVEPNSIVVDDYPSTSQHACATLPLGGSHLDRAGAVRGVDGLRVVDGSVLPHGGRSGPQETVMVLGCLIGDELIR